MLCFILSLPIQWALLSCFLGHLNLYYYYSKIHFPCVIMLLIFEISSCSKEDITDVFSGIFLCFSSFNIFNYNLM